MNKRRVTRGIRKRNRQSISEDMPERRKDLPILLFLLVAVGGIVTITLSLRKKASNVEPAESEFVTVEELGPPPSATTILKSDADDQPTTIKIALSDLAPDGRVQFFEFSPDGESLIRFIAAVRSDGKAVSALDTCEACYRENRGFSPIDGIIACRKCGRVFAIDEIEYNDSDCRPILVPHKIDNGSIVLNTRDLQALNNRYGPSNE